MAGDLSDAKQSFFIFVRDPNTNKVERVAIPGDVQVGLQNNPADLTLMGRFAINSSEYQITAANGGIIRASDDDCIIGVQLASTPSSNTALLILPQSPREGQLAFVKDMTGTSTTVPITISPGTGLLIDDKSTALLSASYGSSALAWFAGQWRTIGGGGTGGGGGGGTVTDIQGAGGSTVTHVGSVYTVSSSIGVSSVVGIGGSTVTKIGAGTEYQVSSSIGADKNASYILVSASSGDVNARILSGGVGINIQDNGPGGSLIINGVTGDGWYTALDIDLTAQGNINPLTDTSYSFTGNPGGTLTKINSSHDDVASQIKSGLGWYVNPSNSSLGLNNGKYSNHTLSSFTIPLVNLDPTVDPTTPLRIWMYIASQTQAPQGSGGVGEGQFIYTDDWNGTQYTWSWHCNAGFGGSGNGWYVALQSPTGAPSTGQVDAYTNPPNVMMMYLPEGTGGRIAFVFRKDIAGNSWPAVVNMVPYLYIDGNTTNFNSGTLDKYEIPTAMSVSWGVTGDPAFSGGDGYSTLISRVRVDYYRPGVGNVGPTGPQGLPGTQGISASYKQVLLPHNPYTSVDFNTGLYATELNSLTASVQIDNKTVATLTGSTFSGPIIATDNPGITGSLTQLRSGLAYLISTGTIGLSTNSLGQILISGSGGAGTVTNVTGVGGSSASHIGSVYTISSSVGADLYASYLVASASAQNPNARVLAAGANITLVDTGPGGTLTIASAGTGSNVFTGSLTQTGIPGFPYLVGLGSVTITTNSLGQVLVSGSGGGGSGTTIVVSGTAAQGQGTYFGFVTSSVWWAATGSWQPFLSACPDGIITDVFSQGVIRSGSSFITANGGYYAFHAGFNAYGSDAYVSLRLSSSNGIALSRTTYRTDPADQNLVILDGIFSATVGQTFALQYVSSGTVFAWTGSNPLPGVDAAAMHTGEISVFLLSTSGSAQWIDDGNVLVTTSSVGIDGRAFTPAQGSGTDTYLWVSGTMSVSGALNSPTAVTGSAARKAVFGGDVVISGTLSTLRGSPLSPWTTLLDINFTTQPAQTLSSDGFYDIAGLTWFKSNTANENAPTTIGSAGLTFAPVTATDYSTTTRSGPLLWLPLSQSLLLPDLDWSYSFRLWVYVTVDNPSVNFDECIMGLDTNGTTLSMFFARGMNPGGGTGGFMRNIVNGANISSQNNISFTTSSLNNVMILEWNVLSKQTTATVNSSVPRLFTNAMSGSVTNSAWPLLRTSTYQSMWDTSTLNPSNTFNTLGIVLGAIRGGGGSAHYSCSIGRIRLDYHD